MSVLEIRHDFFDVEARNTEQLYQAFCNHVYLGQWELCRLYLQILYSKRLQLNTNLEELLTDIIKNPTAYCTVSKSVPTPFHFALLLVEECRVKQYLDESKIKSLKYNATFTFLLAVGDIQPSAQVVQEFNQLYNYPADDVTSEILTDSMADFLVDLWLHEIPRVYSFVRVYLYSSFPAMHTWLFQVHKRALDLSLQQLKTVHHQQNKIDFIDLLLSLHFYSCKTNEFRTIMHETLKKIVIYATEAKNNHGQLFDLKTLYRCVLSNGDLARFISELEGEHRRELVNNETVITHFFKKNLFEKENSFWKEIYLYLAENKLDLISCVLNDSKTMILNRDYSPFEQLLSMKELSSLHLYIFLTTWTYVRTVNDAYVLHNSIDTLSNKSDFLVKCLKLFLSHIEFITWLYNVQRNRDGMTSLPPASDLFTLLHTTSPLKLMHQCLDIQTIDPDEILKRLSNTLVNIDDQIKKRTDRKTVTFVDEPKYPDESLGLPQIIASMIFSGYLAINGVAHRILSSSYDDNSNDNEFFSFIRKHLTNMHPLRYRLEILENIFSLIFIQQNELKIKTDEPIEAIEQSVHTTSTSLSPSEKLLSSLRSNLTNDSINTSTNVSVKTQMSFRRADDELDAQTDENVSVCSSSMSSASALHHHPIHRSGYRVDQEFLQKLLLFLQDEVTEVKTLYQKIKDKAIDRNTREYEELLDTNFHGSSIKTEEQLPEKISKLGKTISQALWRYQIITTDKAATEKRENRIDGHDNDDTILYDSTVKKLILPTPAHPHKKRRRSRSRHSESSVSSVTSVVSGNDDTKTTSGIVSKILSTRDNLLAICLKEGKVIEANEVIQLLNMQDHPLAVEAKFSKLFRDAVTQLWASFPVASTATTNSTSNSALADLAKLALSALDNTSLQTATAALLEPTQLKTVSLTLPSSAYFDQEYFESLTLFDLAINAPTTTVSKTLLEMARHHLPIPRPLYSSSATSANNRNTKGSTFRIKPLNEMINNYSQLTNATNSSFYDLLLDVTIPFDGVKAIKIVQYYKRLEEHCRQHYSIDTNSASLFTQVKTTADFFENDPLSKLDLVAYIRNNSDQAKLPNTYMNYFSIFHTYLQNFRMLLDKFPIQDITPDTDLSKYSPLSLIHRIVARSSDVDLAQLQLITSKLNIDISLAVTLSVIRPLFDDKTMAASSLPTHRRSTLLQQQPIDVFFCQQQPDILPHEHCKRHSRPSLPFLKRLASKLEDFSNESSLFNEDPEKIIRTLLTKLFDCIKKIIQDSNVNHMSVDGIEKLLDCNAYDEITYSLPLIAHLDLTMLTTNEERICFFTNLYNMLIIISHIELVRTKLTHIKTAHMFRNDLERLLFLLTTHIDVGQLKQISLYDIRYYLLKQTILFEGLQLSLDPNGPFCRYAPVLSSDDHIKIGLLLNDCIQSSAPFIVLTPQTLVEQLQTTTRDFIDKCVFTKTDDVDTVMRLFLPSTLHAQFDPMTDDIAKFVGEYASSNDVLHALTDMGAIKLEVIPTQYEFAISFDYSLCSSQNQQSRVRRRCSSSSSSSTAFTGIDAAIDFFPPTTTLPNHLIDSRTISFVQDKSPALGQILQIYVQSIIHNQPIESDKTPLKNYFTNLLLSPTLIGLTSSVGDEWFRSIVMNDLTYQYDLLLYLCSLLWDYSRHSEIVELFDSLLPSFIVHSPYCQMIRDLALLTLIKQTPKLDLAYSYLRKIHNCHLLIHATVTYLPRFDGPTCLKLLELCLTSCKKTHQDYVPWIQERLNIMYIYKTLCLGALAQFQRCMEKISKDDDQGKMSIEDMAIKKTSSKCLTWQHAQEHSKRDPLAVVTIFISEKQFDMGHKWLTLLNNHVDEDLIDRVRYKLVEEHIQWLLREENIGNGNRILQIIDTIKDPNDKWHLCTDLVDDLSKRQLVTYAKSIPFSRLLIKFRLIQYMLEHFEENSRFFKDQYDRTKLCVLVTGLALFFNCVPLEQTDSYVPLVEYPLLIIEQLLMNSSIDIAKSSIEALSVLVKKYSLENVITIQQIDEIIECYTEKSVRLNVVQPQEANQSAENKPVSPALSDLKAENRRRSAGPTTQTYQNSNVQETQSQVRRSNTPTQNTFITSIRQRMLPRSSIVVPSIPDSDQQSATSPSNNSPPMAGLIAAKSLQPASIFSNRSSSSDSTAKIAQPSTGEFIVPAVIPSRNAWVSDDEVMICMCCNASQFSMFNRRHHCRRCGRVVCKQCSQQMTLIKSRLERTCKACYQHSQQNPTPVVVSPRPETNPPTKKVDNLRLFSRPISTFKRQSISQVYLRGHRQADSKSSNLLLGTSLDNSSSLATEEPPFLLSSSFTTPSQLAKMTRLDTRTPIESLQETDYNDVPTLPIVNDQVHHQLTGIPESDKILRKDFHYDQSPSISLCLSLIELHSDQYQCGKLLIKLCENLSGQLSSKQRNNEIDYALVLNIIKNLLFTAKMKLMTVNINISDEQLGEQHKLINACDVYTNLVDILNRLNMANCSLPALNELLHQDTLRKIRNKLLDDERYQLAMDISTRCNLDTQTIWFQWGMAHLHIGQYAAAREKFEKCLQRNAETTDSVLKQQQRSGLSQDKIINDIVSYLESNGSMKYEMKCRYLAEQQLRQAGQTHTSLKYLSSLSRLPNVSSQNKRNIHDEILFYLTTYTDDAHTIDYFIRHQLYNEAFAYKCSFKVFCDHIYMPLLKRNHTQRLFNYIVSNNCLSSFAHHFKFVSDHLRDQQLYHSLQQLQIFLNDFKNAAATSIQLFTLNRTTYGELYEKRLDNLQKALDWLQQEKIDTEQSMTRNQSTKNIVNLQLEITRYIYAQLKRLNTNGSDLLPNCPTLFDRKEHSKLILGLLSVSDTIPNAFNFINKVVKQMELKPADAFLPCAEQIGKRRDYRSLQHFLQIIRESGYTDNKLHDDIIETCVRESPNNVEQSREQDTLIQMIKNDDTRINVYMSVGKLRAAYLVAIRLSREDKVRIIRDEALNKNQPAVYDICKKWLENRAAEQ